MFNLRLLGYYEKKFTAAISKAEINSCPMLWVKAFTKLIGMMKFGGFTEAMIMEEQESFRYRYELWVEKNPLTELQLLTLQGIIDSL